VAAESAQKIERQRNDFLKDAWPRAEGLLRVVQDRYAARLRQAGEPVPGALSPSSPVSRPNPDLADPASQALYRLLRAAMHLPAVEALFPTPWPAAARRMLPSPSPQLTATEIWGPVLAWCVLEWLAESISAAQPDRIALDLYDRLRLREPFGHAFAALGFKGEEAWRAAARIKVLLLAVKDAGEAQETAAAAKVESSIDIFDTPELVATSVGELDSEIGEGQTSLSISQPSLLHLGMRDGKNAPPTQQCEEEAPVLAQALWLDPDVRWLCGVREAEGRDYLIREKYEELLWWLQMPALLCFAGEAEPSRAAVEGLGESLATALSSAAAAGFSVGTLLGPLAASETNQSGEGGKSAVPESEPAEPDAEI
jgi:hypothetical protein